MLLALNSQNLRDARALLDQVAGMQPGQVANLEIWREGRRLQVSTRIGKRQAAISGEIAQAAINIGLLFVFPGGLPLLLALALTLGASGARAQAPIADPGTFRPLTVGS